MNTRKLPSLFLSSLGPLLAFLLLLFLRILGPLFCKFLVFLFQLCATRFWFSASAGSVTIANCQFFSSVYLKDGFGGTDVSSTLIFLAGLFPSSNDEWWYNFKQVCILSKASNSTNPKPRHFSLSFLSVATRTEMGAILEKCAVTVSVVAV